MGIDVIRINSVLLAALNRRCSLSDISLFWRDIDDGMWFRFLRATVYNFTDMCHKANY
ncbi:hypothetical protein NT01EI_2197 [Edwardsiella ictaluri 93-146]|uniref:Uncharacterized protein n=1 Tax=Edwardsiella ictaluri (strain 93-146) TaxID=634503 RepID=C5BFU4_EDWI9|nr:hypothetical protein NT01EI_2197 [Edwardsiella ictaluri 93-146]